MPQEQEKTRPQLFRCMERSSFTVKDFTLHTVHVNFFSPSKWRRRKCFFAWYLVAKTRGQAGQEVGVFHFWSTATPLLSMVRSRCVAMWNMRLVSRLKVFSQTWQVNALSTRGVMSFVTSESWTTLAEFGAGSRSAAGAGAGATASVAFDASAVGAPEDGPSTNSAPGEMPRRACSTARSAAALSEARSAAARAQAGAGAIS
mmetsp:Transcript_10524/g.31322  ORF Transcript_10524/g.31322 Transcript_10524/m.31322 type:complete len:202 (-) Transcript_10524:94-699(-)